jgi:AcrR family transcriptional regulator
VARRTQAERSAGTRAALVEAAIDSLVEQGWAATTAVEVCARAGVTRGALHHHFPTLPSLLATALGALYDEAMAVGGPPPTTLVELIDAVWLRIEGARFKAVLETWLAAANDPALLADLGDVIAGFAKLVSADELAAGGLLADETARAVYLTAREAMLGLALGRATNGGRPLGHEDLVLDQLRALARTVDAAR